MKRKEDLRIVYMGTPEFAVAPLAALVEGGYSVVAVVTMPDKPAGRGQKIQYSAVKEYALEKEIPLMQPEKLKEDTFLEELRRFQADLQIVVAFRMLPEVVWNMPPMGTFNLHASLLPHYRGAAPINWAIINGEIETGVTTFFLQHEIDTGNIILQEKTAIGPNENVGSLYERLMNIGAEVVTRTVDLILEDAVITTPQTALECGEERLAPKIFKDTCQLHFNQTATRVHNFVRGLSPYPAAWCELQLQADAPPQVVKLFAVEPIPKPHTLTAGTIVCDKKTYLHIATTDGFVSVKELQLPGKKRMSIGDMLRGWR